jgi:hypothetical protein
VLFVVGRWLVVRGRAASTTDGVRTARWTQSFGIPSDVALDDATRLDMIDRLAMLAEPWCFDALREAALEEHEPQIAGAIAAALVKGA